MPEVFAVCQEAVCAGIAATLVVLGARLLGFHEPAWIIPPFGMAGAVVASLRSTFGKWKGRRK
jgi:hypothetical protein